MISSRCLYSVLPNSFSGLCLCYLYPVSPGTLTINSLPPALVSDVCSFISLFWTSSSLTEQLLFCSLLHWSNYHAVRNAGQMYLYIDFTQKCKLQIQYIFTSAVNVSISVWHVTSPDCTCSFWPVFVKNKQQLLIFFSNIHSYFQSCRKVFVAEVCIGKALNLKNLICPLLVQMHQQY